MRPTTLQEGLLGKLKGAVLDHLRPDDHTRGTAYQHAEESAREALEDQVQVGGACGSGGVVAGLQQVS